MKKSYRAGGVIVNEENKIVLVNEHLWGFPRGGVEEGEDYISVARREILEETGLRDLVPVKKLGVYERYPEGITEDTPGSYPMEIHMFLFRVSDGLELVPEDEKVKETGWFTYEGALERLTNKEDKKFLKSIRSKIF